MIGLVWVLWREYSGEPVLNSGIGAWFLERTETIWKDGGKTEENVSTWRGAERRAFIAWGEGGKRAELANADAIRLRLEGRTEGGYEFRHWDLWRARRALKAYDNAIARDFVDKVPALRQAAEDALRVFESGCRWRAGQRHRRDPHLVSGVREGEWKAEAGWVAMPSGVGTCPDCGGDGGGVREAACGACNGTGRLGGGMYLGGVTILDAPVCNDCRGSGRITVPWTCKRCGGDGVL